MPAKASAPGSAGASASAAKEEVTIRVATTADLGTIVKHRRHMFRDEMGCDAATLDAIEQNSSPYIERGLREGWYRGWLAEVIGVVAAGAGVIVYDWPSGPLDSTQTKRAYLLNVYTEAAFRRRGLARKLVEAAIEWTRAQGFSVLWLHASSHGRPLYESMGFEQTNEMKLKLR